MHIYTGKNVESVDSTGLCTCVVLEGLEHKKCIFIWIIIVPS